MRNDGRTRQTKLIVAFRNFSKAPENFHIYLLHGAASPHFTEPEGSLPHSQASATCNFHITKINYYQVS